MMSKRKIAVTVISVLIGAAALAFAAGKIADKGGTNDTKYFTAFVAVTGPSENRDSRIRRKIAELTGAVVDVERLSGQTPEEKIKSMIAGDKYPDFIDGSGATDLLIKANALVPLDEYLDDYPNLKNYLSDAQWDSLRKEDGHIYFIPPFGVINGHSTSTKPSGEAFGSRNGCLFGPVIRR